MPHAFDTGLAKAQRTLIREAIVAKLAPLRRSAPEPMYLTAIKELAKPFRGESDESGIALLYKAFNGQCPAAAVALGDMSYDPGGMEPIDLVGELEIRVYVASQHQRDPSLVDGRLAADVRALADVTLDPGLETMLEHVEQLLLGTDLDIEGVSVLRGNGTDVVAVLEEVSVGEVRITARVERQLKPWRGVTQMTEAENQLSSVEIPDDEPGFDPFVVTRSTLTP